MKKAAKIFLTSFIATGIFVLADGLVHFLTPLKVTSYSYSFLPIENPLALYLIGKFFGTFIILAFLLWAFSKVKINRMIKHSLIVVLIVSALELRYLFGSNYGFMWHLINFISHYIELFTGISIAKLIVRA